MFIFLQALLQSLFTAAATFFGQFLTQKIAKAAAIFTILLALNAAFIAALYAAVSVLALAVPDDIIIAWGWFMPSNADNCLAAIGAIHAARWVYDQNTNFQLSLFR